MRCLNGKKLSAARADHADDIDAQMAAIFGHPGFATLFVPALSGTRIALKAGHVGKPNIHIAPLEQLLKFLQKRCAQPLILFVQPWLGLQYPKERSSSQNGRYKYLSLSTSAIILTAEKAFSTVCSLSGLTRQQVAGESIP